MSERPLPLSGAFARELTVNLNQFTCDAAGEEATRLIVDEGRKVAIGLQGTERTNLIRTCDEVEMLTDQLSELCRMGQV